MFATTTRNATLPDLVEILRTQHARKLDVVTPASQIRARGGLVIVEGSEPVLSADGVTSADGQYLPTAVFDEGIADKFKIPLSYVRRMRAERPDLWDANVNGFLHGFDGAVPADADSRKFMLRLFRGDDGGVGVGRAFLSDSYKRIENLDVLMSALTAIRDAGVETDIVGADLSDRRMYVRVSAPQVQALAPELLRNYRSPFSGQSGADNPVVFAGFEIGNSEVGNGAFSITPRLVVQVCSNGMKVTKDAVRSVHLGGKLEEGVIRWSDETQQKQLEVISAKTRDAVRTFLDVDYMRGVIAGMSEQAAVPVSNAVETLTTLSKKLQFDDATQAGILDHFIKGGDVTAGGVLHAVTSFAQTVSDADAAADLESSAFKAMELAAAAR